MKRTIGLLLGSLLVSGCVHHRHGLLPPGHVKHVAHVHGHACGHTLQGGIWIMAPVPPPGKLKPHRGRGRR